MHSKSALAMSLATLSVALGVAGSGQAATALAYGSKGAYNAQSYTFKAQNTGDITAYFAGASAAFDSQITLLVNGVATKVFGLDNQTSKVGDSLNFGHVNAGDTLVFVLKIASLGGASLASDSAMNAGYGGGQNHIFSTTYDGSNPALSGVPAGAFIGFEDLTGKQSDYDYNDETFVFTNVAASGPHGPQSPPTSAVPEPASWATMLIGLAALGGLSRRVRRVASPARAV